MQYGIVDKSEFIWLASYPRSGNTYLRTIIWHCFGLRSSSIYPNDLGGRKNLENYAGHIERSSDGKVPFAENDITLVKTHEYPGNNNPVIYVVRDGRAACVSLWEFYNRELPLGAVIEGRHRFGTWANHVRAWEPYRRPRTLLLKYEDMLGDLPITLEKLSTFLQRDILNTNIPPRETIAEIDDRWVRKRSDWRIEMSDELIQRFSELNGEMLEFMGYQ